jgi:hypothetical protein
VNQKRAISQLALVRAVLQGERKRGTLSAELVKRASEIVEETSRQIGPDGEADVLALLAEVRAEVAEELSAKGRVRRAHAPSRPEAST